MTPTRTKEQEGLQPIIKCSGSLCSDILLKYSPLHAGVTWPGYIGGLGEGGDWVKEMAQENVDVLATAMVVSNNHVSMKDCVILTC